MVEAQLHIIKKQLYLVYCIIVLARIIVVVIFFLPENDSNSTVLLKYTEKGGFIMSIIFTVAVAVADVSVGESIRRLQLETAVGGSIILKMSKK